MSGMEEAWPSGAMSVIHDGTSGLQSGRCSLLLKAHCWVLRKVRTLPFLCGTCSQTGFFLPPAHISPDVNYEELARCTDDFNGAQCKAVCVEAVSIALQQPVLVGGRCESSCGIVTLN